MNLVQDLSQDLNLNWNTDKFWIAYVLTDTNSRSFPPNIRKFIGETPSFASTDNQEHGTYSLWHPKVKDTIKYGKNRRMKKRLIQSISGMWILARQFGLNIVQKYLGKNTKKISWQFYFVVRLIFQAKHFSSDFLFLAKFYRNTRWIFVKTADPRHFESCNLQKSYFDVQNSLLFFLEFIPDFGKLNWVKKELRSFWREWRKWIPLLSNNLFPGTINLINLEYQFSIIRQNY